MKGGIRCLSTDMKNSLRACGLCAPAPRTGHAVNAAVRSLAKVNARLRREIMGCRMSAFLDWEEEMRGV